MYRLTQESNYSQLSNPNNPSCLVTNMIRLCRGASQLVRRGESSICQSLLVNSYAKVVIKQNEQQTLVL